MKIQVILNADDFGRSTSINQAVIHAHRNGVLTSASLLMTGAAVEEAVALAYDTPTLAVGLHIAVAGAQAISPVRQISHLVDAHGRFSHHLLRIGIYYFLSRTAQVELKRELVHQFDRFAATGLPLSHVDSHFHFHIHPRLFPLILSLAQEYGASGIRLPRDDIWLALSYNPQHAGMQCVQALILLLLCRWYRYHLQKYRLVTTHRVYGLMQSGQMHESYVVRVLRSLKVPTAELYFHPSLADQRERLGPNPGDLATLLSPAVRQVIQERGLQLATYPTLQEGT